jgi:hypothetical protein
MGLFDWLTGKKEEKAEKVVPAKPIDHDGVDDLIAVTQRNETFAHRRDQEDHQMGPPVASKDLMSALGHYTDAADPERVNRHGEAKLLRGHENDDPDVVAQHAASHEIHNHYMINSKAEFDGADKILKPEDTKLDLSTPDAKLKAMNNFTQNQAGRMDGESECAAASLVAAAVLSDGKKGTDGLAKLMNAMDANALDKDERKNLDSGVMKVIRDKMKKGQDLTIQDLHRLQDQLYTEMHYHQALKANELDATDPKAAAALRADGLQANSITGFLDKSPEMRKMMDDNHMAVSFIDNNGQTRSPHATLSIGDDGSGRSKAVYDPEARDEGQIVTGKTELDNYKKAQLQRVK